MCAHKLQCNKMSAEIRRQISALKETLSKLEDELLVVSAEEAIIECEEDLIEEYGKDITDLIRNTRYYCTQEANEDIHGNIYEHYVFKINNVVIYEKSISGFHEEPKTYFKEASAQVLLEFIREFESHGVSMSEYVHRVARMITGSDCDSAPPLLSALEDCEKHVPKFQKPLVTSDLTLAQAIRFDTIIIDVYYTYIRKVLLEASELGEMPKNLYATQSIDGINTIHIKHCDISALVKSFDTRLDNNEPRCGGWTS